MQEYFQCLFDASKALCFVMDCLNTPFGTDEYGIEELASGSFSLSQLATFYILSD